MATASLPPNTRRYLSADGMVEILRSRFGKVPDHRRACAVDYSMTDTLTSAYAMFSLKDPSLLAFQERVREPSIHKLCGIKAVPSDTQMRDTVRR